MVTDANAEYREYIARELQILVLCARHLPQCPVGPAGLLISDVLVELSFDDKVASTQHVFTHAKDQAVFHRKWKLDLVGRTDKPLTIKIKDRNLGTIGTRDFTIPNLPYHAKWTPNIPIIHWCFVPKSPEISALNAKAEVVRIHAKPCELDLILIVSKRTKVAPEIRHKNWCNCYRKPRPFAPKVLPSQRTRHWVVRNSTIQELEWNPVESPHEWTTMAISHMKDVEEKRIGPLDRRSPNRQAFVRRQSGIQMMDLLQHAIVPSKSVESSGALADLANLLSLSAHPNEQAHVVLEEQENDISPEITKAGQRFMGRMSSCTGLLNMIKDIEPKPFHFAKKSVWNSLPNLLIEYDRRDSLLNSVMGSNFQYSPSRQPLIQTVCPRRVPVHSRVAVTLTGQHLGESRADIELLWIAGLDCLDSVEYLSRNKLRCTTRPFLAAAGTVIIVTKSGGQGRCLQQFEFYNAADLSHLHYILEQEDMDIGERMRLHEEAMNEEISQLVSSVVTLEQYNCELQQYLQDVKSLVDRADPTLIPQFHQLAAATQSGCPTSTAPATLDKTVLVERLLQT
ncbi:hypothetical protein BV898_11646 [Hypsibius exemplaris]|uniref:IPT/TIG domain-containing protein n=1 Tax=Hypsibius exemplaris TaxID=2072580 RepID=A0A1W0WG46_HYPEX|nr:hypothetical protein BV898_11646 [Hypsibius exemplaris]